MEKQKGRLKMIVQHNVNQSINHLLDLIWYVHETDLPLERQEDIIVPSGHIHIVYNFMDPYFLKTPKGLLQVPDIVLVGQFKKAMHIQYGKDVKQLGLAFSPTAFRKLFGEVSGLYMETMVDCHLMSGMKGLHDVILKIVDESHSPDEIIDSTEKYFTSLSIEDTNEKVYDDMIVYIESRKGLIDVSQMAYHFGYSMSALERNFKKVLGLTPKAYANIVRFRYAVLEEDPTCLFYDQSHYIKNCKKYTGKIPADLSQSEEISLLNMLNMK